MYVKSTLSLNACAGGPLLEIDIVEVSSGWYVLKLAILNLLSDIAVSRQSQHFILVLVSILFSAFLNYDLLIIASLTPFLAHLVASYIHCTMIVAMCGCSATHAAYNRTTPTLDLVAISCLYCVS